MIQAYSENITVPFGSAIPFNNVSKIKGCDQQLRAPATFELDRCGVYNLTCHGNIDATGEVTVQVYQDGIAIPEAQATMTLTAGDIENFSFDTLITVDRNNTKCCCSSPTLIQIRVFDTPLTDGEATFDLISCTITRLC